VVQKGSGDGGGGGAYERGGEYSGSLKRVC
jgi:hypothetical protein